MNTPDLEMRLKLAATVAAPPRSVVDDVMRRLPVNLPKPAPRFPWRHPVLAAGLAACTGLAATVVVIFFLLAGPSLRLSLADVQEAVKQQLWVHIRYDAGQIKEEWANLQTGESYFTRYDGSVGYINDQTNIRLWYWKNNGVIDQDSPTIYAPGQAARPWTPQTAWDEFVAPFEHAAAATKPADASAPPVVSVQDMLDGVPVVRFDDYFTDFQGHRFLYSQLWADRRTHLPLRIKTRLQHGERETADKEWSTGDYDFPRTGPTDLFALGVPRDTPIKKEVIKAPEPVRTILEAIDRNHDNFLKNYRAVVVRIPENTAPLMCEFDIIWRDGDKVRQDIHLIGTELRENPDGLPSKLIPAALLPWAAQHKPIKRQLLGTEYEYKWTSATAGKNSEPRVSIMRRHRAFPLLDTHSWPEDIQWPTRRSSPDFRLLDANADTPAGCIGIRNGGEGNYREDYYVDPANDYVCVKRVAWTKRGTEWFKTLEHTLVGLRRIGSHVVVGSELTHEFDDPAQNISDSTETTTIDVVPLTAADYPPATFDPASFTTGAKVEGY